MQPNPNDPYYPAPREEAQPGIPYQTMPPLYPAQSEEQTYYYSQQEALYVPSAEQAPYAPQGASDRASREKQARKYSIAKLMDYLQWVLLCLEILLLLQFGLKLVGADPTNPFAAFLYAFAGFFLYPFQGIVPSTKLGPHGNAIIVWSTLIAMAIYALLFYLVKLLLRTTISRPQEPIE